jgi:DnaJ-class molecular chaperone
MQNDADLDTLHVCPRCFGEGVTTRRKLQNSGQIEELGASLCIDMPSEDLSMVCPQCYGEGVIVLVDDPNDASVNRTRSCHLCEGTGKVTQVRVLELWKEYPNRYR